MKQAVQVLIVDDERTLLENLSRAAQSRGFAVDTAADGSEAWQRLSERSYGLVVSDLRMPGMDGAELLQRIADRGEPTRVVVMTGHATLEAAVDCLRKGAVDFLVKPFEVESFLGSLARAMERPLAHLPAPNWGTLEQECGLTRRETEILRAFYSTGAANRELAENLALSTHTVKSHLKAAFLKLGVRSRAELLRALRFKAR